MANTVISNLIEQRIKDVNVDEKTLIVLKGIPVSIVDPSVKKIHLEAVIKNRMGYFMSIYGTRNVLSYEEFLLLADFAVAQYKEIYILNKRLLA